MLLFVVIILFPLFTPEGTEVDKLTRALLAFTLILSTFLAEALRGALQSLHVGQYEASQALGLSYLQTQSVCCPASGRVNCAATDDKQSDRTAEGNDRTSDYRRPRPARHGAIQRVGPAVDRARRKRNRLSVHRAVVLGRVLLDLSLCGAA